MRNFTLDYACGGLVFFIDADEELTEYDAIIEFLLALTQQMPTKIPLGIANCELILRRVVKGRSSSLQSREELRQLHLPTVDELL